MAAAQSGIHSSAWPGLDPVPELLGSAFQTKDKCRLLGRDMTGDTAKAVKHRQEGADSRELQRCPEPMSPGHADPAPPHSDRQVQRSSSGCHCKGFLFILSFFLFFSSLQ